MYRLLAARRQPVRVDSVVEAKLSAELTLVGDSGIKTGADDSSFIFACILEEDITRNKKNRPFNKVDQRKIYQANQP